MIYVGKIIGHHGKGKALKVEPFSDVVSRFQPGSSLLMGCVGGDFFPVTVEKVFYSGQKMVLRFKEDISIPILSPGDDWWLAVKEQFSPIPAEGTYYHYQLIGLSVYERGILMGHVCSVVESLTYDYLEVEKSGKHVLVPFIREFIKQVDLEAGKVFTNCPVGLWDELED